MTTSSTRSEETTDRLLKRLKDFSKQYPNMPLMTALYLATSGHKSGTRFEMSDEDLEKHLMKKIDLG